jgi:hypothetical protein
MKVTLLWWAVIIAAVIVGEYAHRGWRQDECKKCEEWRDSLPAPNERRSNPCESLCK